MKKKRAKPAPKKLKKKPTEKRIEVPAGPVWRKIEDFIYELKDPSGGIYRCVARREMTENELFAKWNYTYLLCRRARPGNGEVHFMVLPN